MPHLILECSGNISNEIPFETLFQQLHQLLAGALPTQLASFKSRVISYEKYYVGTDFEKNAFLHLTIKIMPGRSDEVKDLVGKEVLKMLNDLNNDLDLNNVSLSVELIDLNTHYFKKTI